MTCLECGEAPVYARSMCRRCYHRYYMRMVQSPETWEGWPHQRTFTDNRGRRCQDCLRRAVTKGFCRRHYKRFLKLRDDGFWDQVDAYTKERLST